MKFLVVPRRQMGRGGLCSQQRYLRAGAKISDGMDPVPRRRAENSQADYIRSAEHPKLSKAQGGVGWENKTIESDRSGTVKTEIRRPATFIQSTDD